jgi:hypothetical protein
MASPFKISKIMMILLVLAALGAIVPAASAVFDSYQNEAPPCCPIFEDYPDYYYPVDPYYQFPLYCSCPFLDDALERFEEWDIPSSYWEYVINQESQCTTCTGSGSTVMSYSYSNSPLIIPEKDSIMTAYDKISVSTTIKSKDLARAAFG